MSLIDGWSTTRGLVAAIAIFTWVGCGGGADEAAEGGVAEAGTAETVENGGATDASCVADYEENPCDLLTEELVRGEVPDAPAEIEQESVASLSSCTYTWASGRKATRTVGDMEVEYDVSSTVGISWIETYGENANEQFRRAYLPTEQEMQRGREMMQEEFEERAEEEGLTEEQRQVGEELAESASSGMTFEPVDGVGSNASWSAGDAALYVLDGATKFQITANVSADEAANRDAAISIARAVMGACE